MTLISAIALLFLVIDPFGNIPIFISVLRSVDPARRRLVIAREHLIALGILVVFLFTGRYILLILKISQPSISIAGGIVFFLIAIKMVFSGTEDIFSHSPLGEPFIVPLAVPLIAGPSAMAAVLLLMAREPARWFTWLLALFFAWCISGIVLLFADTLSRLLGEKCLAAFERLMGMLIIMVAVEMFINGVRSAFF